MSHSLRAFIGDQEQISVKSVPKVFCARLQLVRLRFSSKLFHLNFFIREEVCRCIWWLGKNSTEKNFAVYVFWNFRGIPFADTNETKKVLLVFCIFCQFANDSLLECLIEISKQAIPKRIRTHHEVVSLSAF